MFPAIQYPLAQGRGHQHAPLQRRRRAAQPAHQMPLSALQTALRLWHPVVPARTDDRPGQRRCR